MKAATVGRGEIVATVAGMVAAVTAAAVMIGADATAARAATTVTGIADRVVIVETAATVDLGASAKAARVGVAATTVPSPSSHRRS